MKKIVFYNQFHNGDCFVGKSYVADLAAKLGVEVAYAHNNHPDIIKDLGFEQLGLNNIPPMDRMSRIGESKDKETVYVNTWVGCWQGTMFPFGEHINFIRLHNIWREYFKYFNVDFVEDPNYYLPRIDYSQYDVSGADTWLAQHAGQRHVLICNGTANSGQSRVGDLRHAVNRLADEHPDINFILTQKLDIQRDNIYYTDDIFANVESDLNQIAYLASQCELIVGKNSGPFTYCQNAANLANPNLTFFNLSILPTDCPSGGGLYFARCVHTAEVNEVRIAVMISTLLENKEYRGTESIL